MERSNIDCQNCDFWGFDMDMEPFCIQENSGPLGTDIRAMRGTVKTRHMRGEPCGPEAKYFKQGTHRWAKEEKHAKT